mmetsp:Transcript_8029/g.14072  ORF Transcript_8029/g.14072 Transcript_8029/m.14072 type:complete len:157 (+) Transcript_8029:110-580(+)
MFTRASIQIQILKTMMQPEVVVLSTIFLFLVHLSQAWTNTASVRLPSSRLYISSKTSPSRSSALQFQNSNNPLELSEANIIYNELDTELRLQAALEAARDADRRYGLCTPASTRAWQIVDDIYSSSSKSRHVEENVKKVFGSEKSIWSSFEKRNTM